MSSMSIPTLRPYLKNFVMAGWTQHSITDNFIDTQLVRVDDNPVAVTSYWHLTSEHCWQPMSELTGQDDYIQLWIQSITLRGTLTELRSNDLLYAGFLARNSRDC